MAPREHNNHTIGTMNEGADDRYIIREDWAWGFSNNDELLFTQSGNRSALSGYSNDERGRLLTGLGNDSVTVLGDVQWVNFELGSGADTLTITGRLTAASVVTGAGADRVTLNNVTNSGINTGADADRVTLTGTIQGTAVNLGEGNDTLDIRTATFTGRNVLDGGAGIDTAKFNGSALDYEISRGTNPGDVLMRNKATGATVTLKNFESLQFLNEQGRVTGSVNIDFEHGIVASPEARTLPGQTGYNGTRIGGRE